MRLFSASKYGNTILHIHSFSISYFIYRFFRFSTFQIEWRAQIHNKINIEFICSRTAQGSHLSIFNSSWLSEYVVSIWHQVCFGFSKLTLEIRELITVLGDVFEISNFNRFISINLSSSVSWIWGCIWLSNSSKQKRTPLKAFVSRKKKNQLSIDDDWNGKRGIIAMHRFLVISLKCCHSQI